MIARKARANELEDVVAETNAADVLANQVAAIAVEYGEIERGMIVEIRKEAPVFPAGPRPWLFDLTAFVGVGGTAIAFTVYRMRGAASVPVQDPYIEDSLRYLPP